MIILIFETCIGLPTTNLSLFAGTWDGGVFLSTNNGTNWTAVNNGLTNLYINSLFVIGNNLFAATRAGVFNSINLGTSWAPVNSGLTDLYVYALGVIGTNLYASTAQSVFVSADNGVTWTAASLFPTFSKLVNAGPVILSLSDFEILASPDLGTTWINFDNNGLPNSYQFSAMPVRGSTVYLGTNFNGMWSRPLGDFVFIVDGIGEINKPQTVRLYPNPSDDFIFVTGIREPVASSAVVDMLGKPSPLKLDQQDNVLVGNVRNLASGIYILKIKGATGVCQIKFVKP